MKAKKILLVNNNPHEVQTIQKVLEQMNVKFSMVAVGSGKEACDTLMGSSSVFTENYFRSRKVRPDIILIDNQLSDMTGVEFIGIVRKYYSLKNIKVLLLADPKEHVDHEVLKRLSVTGCLERPFENTEDTYEKFKILKLELASDLALMPLISFPNMKSRLTDNSLTLKKAIIKGIQFGHTIGAKIAASIAVIFIIGGAASYNGNTQVQERSIPAFKPRKILIDSSTKEIPQKPIIKKVFLSKKPKNKPEVQLIHAVSSDCKRMGSHKKVRNLKIKFIEENDSTVIH